MKNLCAKYTTSLEGVADGNSHVEKELVYYAILEDTDFLKTAALIEKHEQWTIKIPKTDKNLSEGQLRVRSTNDGEKFIFCSKLKGKDGTLEVELESTEDQFNQFKAIAESGMIKTRYSFPIPDTEGFFPNGPFDGSMVWEIDVFHKANGLDVEWVKIDLEIPERPFDEELKKFPFATKQLITSQYPNRTEEDEKIVSDLYENHYITKHV